MSTLEGQQILVVEDDGEIRSVLAELLAQEGYQVASAPNGKEALDLIGRVVPKAILLDLMMPVMDGWTFMSKCRNNPVCREIPIVVLSAAHGLQAQAERLKEEGIRAVLPKPFDVDALLGTVHRIAPLAS